MSQDHRPDRSAGSSRGDRRPDLAALIAAFVAAPDDGLASPAAVQAVTDLSGSTIDRQEKAGTFPKARKLGTRCKRYVIGEVRLWLKAQAAGAGQWAAAPKQTGSAVATLRPITSIGTTPPKRGRGRPRKQMEAATEAAT